MNHLFRDKLYSKWLILLIDCLIVSWSLLVAYLLVYKFQINEIPKTQLLFFLFTYNIITVLVFVGMKIHEGIVRYSNLNDVLRVFKVTILSNFIFWIVAQWFVVFNNIQNVKWINIIIPFNFFITFSTLVVLRLLVRALFQKLEQTNVKNAESIVIYGIDKNAIIVKQAFEVINNQQYKVVGFIEDNLNKVNKFIEQKKVYSSNSLSYLNSKYNVSKMVVVDNYSHLDNRFDIIQKCIELGIKVITVPPTSQWVNGKLSLNQVKDIKIDDLLQREPIILENEQIFTGIAGKRVLVTGAAGSIGSEIVKQLLNYNPSKLIISDHAETPLYELKISLEDKISNILLEVFMCNIQNLGRLKKMFSDFRPQIVFHAAASKHVPMMENNPTEAILTNVLGTKQLADVSLEFKVEKFIMISTDKAVKPTNVMGASKRIAEMYIQSLNFNQIREDDDIPTLQKSNTKFITTRFGNVLGSNGSVVPRFKEQIEKGGPLTVTHPDITRYFMTIPEAVQLVLEACVMGKGGEIFIFDMGKPIKILELAKNMIKLAGLCPEKDIQIVFTGLRPGEKLYEELLNQEEEVLATYHDKIKISKVINYQFLFIKNMLDELLSLINEEDEFLIVKKMKEILPDFKSNNSIFNKLDVLKANKVV